MKTCPFCAETNLQDNAKVCKHCGKDIVKNDVALEIAARSRYSAFSLDVVAFWFCLGFGLFQLFFTDYFWRGIFLVVAALIGRAYRLSIYKKQILQEMELENPSINLSHPSKQQEPQRTKYGQEQQNTQWIDEKLKQSKNKLFVGVVLIFLGIVGIVISR